MAFWSSQKIEINLVRLTDHPDPKMVDCNALTLRLGSEIYITPGLEQPAPSSHTKQILKSGDPVAIPPGQFAFLLSEEKVTIPPEVMGFISIKATYKLKGLVNVSGFHVDPGWTGRLTFTVFNAGPATIHLEQGLPIFLLWIADLDEKSEKRKTVAGPPGIPPGVISNITGVVDSIYALEKRTKAELKDVADKMKSELKEVSDKQNAFRDQVSEIKERQHKVLFYFGMVAVVGGTIVGVAVKAAADYFFPAKPPVIAEQKLQSSVPPIVVPSPDAPPNGGRKP